MSVQTSETVRSPRGWRGGGTGPDAEETRAALPDHALVALAQGGDNAAFALLIERHRRGIYAFAYRFLGDEQDTDDAVQETFARAYSRLCTYTPDGRFGSWILAICAHWCIDTLRARRRRVRTVALGRVPETEHFISDIAGPEECALRWAGGEEMRGWLDALPPDYRTVLALRYAQERSYGEIAAALDLPLTTVRMRLFRARAALRMIATPRAS